MAITKTWEINTMKRDVSDGYVTQIIFRVKGISGSEEKARETGEVLFEKPDSLPSDLLILQKLDAATVLGWVKTALGDKVVTIETRLEAAVTSSYTSAVGVPWSTE